MIYIRSFNQIIVKKNHFIYFIMACSGGHLEFNNRHFVKEYPWNTLAKFYFD